MSTEVADIIHKSVVQKLALESKEIWLLVKK